MSQRRDGFVRHDGTYETALLRSAKVAVGIVQTPVRAVDGDNPEAGIRDNLAYMLNAIDKAQQTGGRCDLLCFHEFPLHGFRSEEHTSELKSLMRISYAVFCLKKKKNDKGTSNTTRDT